jgi:membrane protein involved in colicin uptake
MLQPEGSDMTEKSKGYEANAQFAKVQRAQDAKKATSEYESAAAALRAKTEKLKALRLARDAAAPPQPAAAKRKAKRKATSGSLSDWLDGQAKDGRSR